MREADKYRYGKYSNLSTLTKISYSTCALTLFIGLMEDSQWLQTAWFVIAALQFSTAISFFIKKGFLELIDAEYELKSNQNIEPIVTTPVDEVEAQSTQAHV